MVKPDFSKPLLQVALDFTRIDDALRIAEVAWSCGADIIEAGTPLIKSEGLKAVEVLRRELPDATIVADMKTVDVGDLEVRMAAEAGADIVTVMGFSWDSTITAAVEEARRQGVMVEADLMYVEDPAKRAGELKKLGVDIVGIHIGIDVQKRLGMTAGDVPDLVRRVVKAFGGIVSVAGGIKAEHVPSLIKAGAKIIVVGSAITRARDPSEATRIIRDAILKALEGDQ